MCKIPAGLFTIFPVVAIMAILVHLALGLSVRRLAAVPKLIHYFFDTYKKITEYCQYYGKIKYCLNNSF
jgi:hypothetical protein